MRRSAEIRWLRLGLLAGATCLPVTLSGCAALQEANKDMAEVMQSTANLLDPNTVGVASPRATEIDKRLQAMEP